MLTIPPQLPAFKSSQKSWTLIVNEYNRHDCELRSFFITHLILTDEVVLIQTLADVYYTHQH